MSLPQEIIRKKRDGNPLAKEEMAELVRGMADGSLSEGQIAAFAMAVFFQGLSAEETVSLTTAMRDSGPVMRWDRSKLHGPVLDKHSTGGVGDTVSLMLAPMVAACGAHVPMISGRALGHTGGTLDKLCAIPGYDAFPKKERFQKIVSEIGVAIIGQTDDLAPADRRFYSVRDITATVESVPLITASILSKKLAAGIDALVMDIKVGNGAFMPTLGQARELSESIVSVATQSNTPTSALITDMNQVLAPACGNSLEILCAIDYLKCNTRPERLHEITLALGAKMLTLGKIANGDESARKLLIRCLDNGSAAERFSKMISALGGPSDLLSAPAQHLQSAPIIKALLAKKSGYVSAMNVKDIGVAILELGSGRRRAEDAIDPRVGLSEVVPLGTQVETSTPIAMVHAASESAFARAAQQLGAAIRIDSSPPVARDPLIYATIEASDARS